MTSPKAVLLGLVELVLYLPAALMLLCAAVILWWVAAFPHAELQVPALLAVAAVLAVPGVVFRRLVRQLNAAR